MTNILYRIEQISQNEHITIGALERAIGASKGVLSRAITNNTDIQSKWLQKIGDNYPQYSAEWLLTGRGNMMHSIPLKEYDCIEKNLNVSEECATYKKMESEKSNIGIPFIPFSFLDSEIDLNCNSFKKYSLPFFNEADFLIRVSGNFADPIIISGDVIACRLLKKEMYWFQPDRAYFLSTVQGPMIGYIEIYENDSFIIVSSKNIQNIKIPIASVYNVSIILGVAHIF